MILQSGIYHFEVREPVPADCKEVDFELFKLAVCIYSYSVSIGQKSSPEDRPIKIQMIKALRRLVKDDLLHCKYAIEAAIIWIDQHNQDSTHLNAAMDKLFAP